MPGLLRQRTGRRRRFAGFRPHLGLFCPYPAARLLLLHCIALAARYETASADEQSRWSKLLASHQEQLREWAERYPPTFADKHILVSAEIARIEGRELDAERLYEQAIRSARDNGFRAERGPRHELAARFYAARGFATIAHAYLRNARHCYLRWGPLARCGNSMSCIRRPRERGAVDPAQRARSARRSNTSTSRP